jgi:hypothetical protein
MDEVRVDHPGRGTISAPAGTVSDGSETAVPKRTAVSRYVALTALAAAGCVAAALTHDAAPLTIDLVAFVVLAALTDLREIKMPLVGIVTLSFVPVLACLIVFGLWQALVVAAASGLTTAWFTRDPLKIAFNVANYIISTFLSGLLFLALAPAAGSFMSKVLPTFAATVVDFVVNTVLLAVVIGLVTQ